MPNNKQTPPLLFEKSVNTLLTLLVLFYSSTDAQWAHTSGCFSLFPKMCIRDRDKKQQKYISDYFDKVLFPVLTPLAVDESRPFPLLANKSLNIAVRLKGEDDESCFALVQVP